MDKTTATLAATVRDNDEGEQRWFCGGGVFTWKATAQETGGAFLIFEDVLAGGKVTPLHLHPDADETFYWCVSSLTDCLVEGDTAAGDLGQDGFCGGGPDEGFGALVVHVHVFLDRGDQVGHAVKDASSLCSSRPTAAVTPKSASGRSSSHRCRAVGQPHANVSSRRVHGANHALVPCRG